jgi:uncharacterized protein (DUF2147 family)
MKGVAMKPLISLLFISLLSVSASTATFAAGADDILGLWFNGEKDARIEIAKCAEKYCGKIVWLKDPNYPDGSKDGAPGTPKLDHNNPDGSLKKAPIIGLQIVSDFIYDSENIWKDGRVYDPKNGKTYKGKMTLVSPNQLDLRGYIGISIIGRTTSWTR